MNHNFCAESYDGNDEFHRELHALNRAQGDGYISAIVWNDGIQKPGTRSGMVICQHPSSMTARRFTVEHSSKTYTLKFLSKTVRIVSDYFA